MKYDISKTTAPTMPKLGRGLESVALLLSQVSKDMHQPIVPMLFPILGAHVSGAEFMYPDLSWKEPSGMLANLVADSGAGKGQLSSIVEAVCRDFRAHDDEELAKLVEWQKMMKTKSANKEKPARPDVAFWFPPADVTNAAFIQNAMGCEKLGQRTQYLNMPEVEMADRVCGGHRQISQMMRNIYDRQRAGALRATADGVTGNPALEFESLTRDPFLIAAPPDTHLSALAKQKEGAPYPELDPALLGDEPFLMVSPGQRIRQITDRVLAEAGVKPNIVLTSRNYELLRRLTGEGMGCMLLPSRYIGLLGGESYRPAYYMIPPKYRAWWALSVVRLREAYLSRAAQAFLGSFKAHLAEDSP